MKHARSILVWAPRVGAAGAVLTMAPLVLDGLPREALGLAAASGALVALGLAALFSIARPSRSTNAAGTETVVRALALLAALWAGGMGLLAYDQGQLESLPRLALGLGFSWILLAEIVAPALQAWLRPVAAAAPARRAHKGLLALAAGLPACYLLLWSTSQDVTRAKLGPAAAAQGELRSTLPDSSAALPGQQNEEPSVHWPKGGQRVALIGLDGANWELLELASITGYTPHLDRLRREGAWGPLPAEEAFSPPSWTTIATGVSASAHGVDDFFQREYEDGSRLPLSPPGMPFLLARVIERGIVQLATARTWSTRPAALLSRSVATLVFRPLLDCVEPRLRQSFRSVPTDALGIRVARVWELASAAGLETCAVRWLFSLPAAESSGRVLSGWREGWRTPVGGNAPELLDLARSLSAPSTPPGSPQNLEDYLGSATEEAWVGRRLAERIVAENPTLALYTHVFYFPDGLGHRLADELEMASFAAQVVAAPVRRMFDALAEVDALLGMLRARGFALILVSDHGMEAVSNDTPAPIVSQLFELRWDTLLVDLELGEAQGPWFAVESGRDLLLTKRPEAPDGAAAFGQKLLNELVLSDGRRVFDKVLIREGGQLSLSRPVEITRAELAKLQLSLGGQTRALSRYVRDRGIRGLHGRPLPALSRVLGEDGVLAVHGPGLKAGRAAGLTTRDVAPLVLYLLGLPLEPGHQSSGLEILFSADRLEKHPIRRRDQTSPPPRFTAGLVAEPAPQALEALRALGYVN